MNRILVFGGSGLVGSAFVRYYKSKNCNVYAPTHDEFDLECFSNDEADELFLKVSPDVVIIAAAFVGGILANSSQQYDFLYKNLAIQTELLDYIKIYQETYNPDLKVLFLGSTCIYPKKSQSNAKEQDLLSGPLEPTNEGYALAKICGIKQAQQIPNSYCIMPCNLFGINDTYNLHKSHVIPALILKAIQARKNNDEFIKIGGLGYGITRQFMFADDLVKACDLLMERVPSMDLINIGPGAIPLDDIARLISKIIYPKAKLILDETIPLGVLQKQAVTSKFNCLIRDFKYEKFSHALKYTIEKCPRLYPHLKGVWLDGISPSPL